MVKFKSINHTPFDCNNDLEFIRDMKLSQLTNEPQYSRFKVANTNGVVSIPLNTEFKIERVDKPHKLDNSDEIVTICEYKITVDSGGIEYHLDAPQPFRKYFYTERQINQNNGISR